MKTRTILATAMVLAWAIGPSPAEEPAAPAGLERLSWMAGSWRSSVAGAIADEVWLPPGGGMMLGLGREVGPDGRAFFEYLRILPGKDGVLQYIASPRGKGETAFAALEVGKGRVVFANPEHDWPKKIAYWLAEDGSLHARVEGAPGDRVEEYRWERAVR